MLLPLLLSHTSTAPLTTLFLTPIFIPLPHYPTRSIRAADGSTEHSDYVDSFLDADHVTEVQSMLDCALYHDMNQYIHSSLTAMTKPVYF
jgi:hypothetical protein